MIKEIARFVNEFLRASMNKKILLIGHFDTDGISSLAIVTKTLERLETTFSTKIVKQLSKKEIESLPTDKVLLFVDLGSGLLDTLSRLMNDTFIIDHHEIKSSLPALPSNVHLLNPHLYQDSHELCSAELAYLFSRTISEENTDLRVWICGTTFCIVA